MSKDKKESDLIDHFQAPDNYAGRFGWLCGYSADVDFLNPAMDSFSNLTESQRRSEGAIRLVMMLDAHNKRMALMDVPGVAHLPPNTKRPYRLMHAKLALLGFRHQEDPDKWVLRLIVCTGNWTRQTLEDSLDLIWRIDIESQKLDRAEDQQVSQKSADIVKAWEVFKELHNHYDDSLLKNSHAGHSDWFAELITKVKAVNSSKKPRVFHNIEESLLNQLAELIPYPASGKNKDNYLAMGSGFFEAPGKPDKLPSTLRKILEKLEERLTSECEKDIYVNPDSCQAVAASWEAIQKVFTIRRPCKNKNRSLHAKFLFSGKRHSGSFVRSWVYLGSGNLTKSGFCSRAGAKQGNLEVGVVFDSGRLGKEDFIQRLGVDREDETIIVDSKDLPQGDADFEPGEDAVFPPISCLLWKPDGEKSGVYLPENTNEVGLSIQVETKNGWQGFHKQSFVIWEGDRPEILNIQWKQDARTSESLVPVIDENGRVAVQPPKPYSDMGDVLTALNAFPFPPEIDEDDDKPEVHRSEKVNSVNGKSVTSKYPVRKMMILLEDIARQQTHIKIGYWNEWCNRLEEILLLSRDLEVVCYFREELEINPLYPLRHESFYPELSEKQKRGYFDLLKRVQQSWKVDHLTGLGEQQQ